MTLLVLHGLDVMEAQRALVADLDAAGGRGTRGRATDVESAHRQLRSGLADRLRRDHADRLADVDQPAARQIAPVALAAHAVARLAAQPRNETNRRKTQHRHFGPGLHACAGAAFSSHERPALHEDLRPGYGSTRKRSPYPFGRGLGRIRRPPTEDRRLPPPAV